MKTNFAIRKNFKKTIFNFYCFFLYKNSFYIINRSNNNLYITFNYKSYKI